jgi:hypothetical protein
MTRTRIKGVGIKASSSPDSEPNVCALKPCFFVDLNIVVMQLPWAIAASAHHLQQQQQVAMLSLQGPQLNNATISTSSIPVDWQHLEGQGLTGSIWRDKGKVDHLRAIHDHRPSRCMLIMYFTLALRLMCLVKAGMGKVAAVELTISGHHIMVIYFARRHKCLQRSANVIASIVTMPYARKACEATQLLLLKSVTHKFKRNLLEHRGTRNPTTSTASQLQSIVI